MCLPTLSPPFSIALLHGFVHALNPTSSWTHWPENIPAESASQHPQAIAIPSGIHLQQRLNIGPGQFIIQDLASQCVGHVCAPLAGQLFWWDCCAGSGGKSLHLADLMKQQGGVLASDPRESALAELKKRARTCGIRMIQSQILDATQEKPGTHLYDGVPRGCALLWLGNMGSQPRCPLAHLYQRGSPIRSAPTSHFEKCSASRKIRRNLSLCRLHSHTTGNRRTSSRLSRHSPRIGAGPLPAPHNRRAHLGRYSTFALTT